ncbi:hypothetical protein AC579_621 [Lecanosticta acicola]|uniref:C2H2-type domain-containing protein n=1 Tax=Lecanosticta acicola TaxID=111012 RepID=A0AAI9E7B5_9PEZI|nr:hypothetical protein AC579_621 [Lecanosticta acicola]
MAPYNYSNYYDPVGSQANQQPQGYTYAGQSSANAQFPSQTTSNYSTEYNQSYDAAGYTRNQYGTTQQPQASSTTNRAASALSSLSHQNYGQATDTRTSNVGAYDNSYYGTSGFTSMPNRTQSNNSPLYNTAGSTFGRLSVPDPSQTSSTTFGGTQTQAETATTSATSSRTYRNAPSNAAYNYQNSYSQSQQQPPQRYASPLHAVQAQQHQQGHNKPPSRSSNHASSPRMAVHNQQQLNQSQRQPSASVEPSPTTVDPSQVYDMRAEQQRKAQIEAEKRRKIEAQRKAEEQARAAEEAERKAEEDRRAEQERAEREAREAEEQAKKAEEEATKKRAAQDRKNEQRRKAREEKRQSKTAATALTQMASSASGADAMMAAMGEEFSGPPANDEEAEMREMFKKMRQFNQRNPAMLAKLWEEERRQHSVQAASPQPAKPVQAPPPNHPHQQRTSAAISSAQAKQQQPSVNQQAAAAGPSQLPAQSSPVQSSPATAAPSQQGSAALWPPHKKGSLAAAAAEWLTNLPENRNAFRVVGKEELLKILDTNPSYVQLCESVEKKGIKFERSGLAKELLKAVPDGLRAQGPKTTNGHAPVTGPAAPVSGTSSLVEPKKPGRPKKDGPTSYGVPQGRKNRQSETGVSYQAPTFTSLSDAAQQVKAMSTATTFPEEISNSLASAIAGDAASDRFQSPHLAQPTSKNGNSRPPSQPPPLQPQTSAVKDESIPPQPIEPPQPPANKEEAARKRTFNDLVDLTKGDDSDDDGPPRKLQQTVAGPPYGAVKHPAQQNDAFRKPMDYQTFMRQNAFKGIVPGQAPMHPAAPARPWVAYSANTLFNKADQQQQRTPVPSQPRQQGPTEEQKQHERMRGKMLVEPIMRDRVARKSKYDSRTIARDVLLATGRHPDMRALNAHMNSMQKLLGDHGGVIDGAGNKSDLATIRWDIIDPGEPTKEYKKKAKSASAQRGEEAGDSKLDPDPIDQADDEGDAYEARPVAHSRQALPIEEVLRRCGEVASAEEMEQAGDLKMRKQLLNRWHARQYRIRTTKERQESRQAATALRNTTDAGESEEDAAPVQDQIRNGASTGSTAKRGPGRPPKISDVASSANNTPNHQRATAIGTPAPKNTNSSPGSANMSTGGAVGYAAFRQLDENGNVIKRKGRPVGWRKNIHSREAQGLTPAKGGVPASKPLGSRLRQSIGPSSGSKEPSVQPHYQVYKCRWSGCTAELDNLDKLKKHVVKLHGAPDDEGNFQCRWDACTLTGQHVDSNGNAGDGGGEDATFEGIEQWMKHVDKEHIASVAWKLGDGPKGGTVSEQYTDSDSYLSDRQGRSVTPIIRPAWEQAQEGASTYKKLVILTSDLPGGKKPVGRPPQDPSFSGTSKEEREAAAELKKLEEQKKHEGVTMGQEGSKMANAKRRRGFLDDEDFEDIVLADEDHEWTGKVE